MTTQHMNKYAGIAFFLLAFTACKMPAIVEKKENKTVSASYANSSQDSTNTATQSWRQFFTDPNLVSLIDTALKNNQELNITLQEIEIARNEVRARKGEYLPFVGVGVGAGVDKSGRYTSKGSSEANTQIKEGKATPDPLPNFVLGGYATWEVDIWHKLRNAQKSAASRYLASVEGKNFMVTNLVTEIAGSYYELLALDNQLAILNQNIQIQSNALAIVKLEKEATRVTELAVRKFEAEVFKTRSLQFAIQQQIIETENRINFLVGRYPQPVARNAEGFPNMIPHTVQVGVPSQLMANRPDIRRAEFELAAAKLDVKVAKARFYPQFSITAGLGYNAFNPSYLLKTPESLMYNFAGDLLAPLVNRNAIKAAYISANAKQIQAVYNYERSILGAYIEVANQVSRISNLQKSYDLKLQQVTALTQSIDISTGLFKSARADYMEVLLTQRDALEARFELIEIKMQQLNASVNAYRAVGGGWR